VCEGGYATGRRSVTGLLHRSMHIWVDSFSIRQ